MMTYLLVVSRCLENFVTITPLNCHDPKIIQSCALINLIYQEIQQTYEQGPPKISRSQTKGHRKTKDQEKGDFFQDPIKQEYLRLINDSSLLYHQED